MCYYFATCESHSSITDKLDFQETRFIDVLSVTREGVSLSLAESIPSDTYTTPGSTKSRIVTITLEQFKSVLSPRVGKVLIADEVISKLYLTTVEKYNPKFNYNYFKTPLSS